MSDDQLDPIRTRILALAKRDGVTLATLSRIVKRNDAYMQQYLRRGSPRVLPERERGVLARFFGEDERALGAEQPFVPSRRGSRLNSARR